MEKKNYIRASIKDETSLLEGKLRTEVAKLVRKYLDLELREKCGDLWELLPCVELTLKPPYLLDDRSLVFRLRLTKKGNVVVVSKDASDDDLTFYEALISPFLGLDPSEVLAKAREEADHVIELITTKLKEVEEGWKSIEQSIRDSELFKVCVAKSIKGMSEKPDSTSKIVLKGE